MEPTTLVEGTSDARPGHGTSAAPGDIDGARVEKSGEVGRTVTLRAPVFGHRGREAGARRPAIMAGEVVYRIADLFARVA